MIFCQATITVFFYVITYCSALLQFAIRKKSSQSTAATCFFFTRCTLTMWDLRQHSERNTVYNLDVHERMYLNLNTVWMYCFICCYLNPDSNIQGWATCCCFVAVDVVRFRVCVHLHVWFIRHVVAACHNTFTSEDHPLSMVSLSFALFMCRLFSSIWAHFIEKTEGALCFSAGSSDFGIICLEAQIKCEFSIVFSITSSNNLLHAGFVFFFMFSPPQGSSCFYVASISLVFVMLSVQCTLILSHRHANLAWKKCSDAGSWYIKFSYSLNSLTELYV